MANAQSISRYADVISKLNVGNLNAASDLPKNLEIATSGNLSIYYAPFEYVNPKARITIVGITPGFTQTRNALLEANRQLRSGASTDAALVAAKQTGAFSGAMRNALIEMLDHCGINRWLGISSATELFSSKRQLLQTTSVLPFPVFVDGKDYNGTPSMIKHPFLKQFLLEGCKTNLVGGTSHVYVPLGTKVSEALGYLGQLGLINSSQILNGMPHPAGQNAERISYFLGKKQKSSLSKKTNGDKIDQEKRWLLEKVSALHP